ncbi:hypothetical protein [Streptomyces griseocarneus]|uniref:Uncharacterized protein n=1 Tax=Streptomyces griseocarneus TaxID=51201 RepID=A0ABX7RT15_9ACTN|nr:hypothetical protein [Streptomyces griseocarneus]QSY50034.1 hypothetical protein J3S04_02920 [Streptomyces griseocarneus]
MCAPHTAPETLVALTGPTATGTRRALELLAGTGLLTGGDRPVFREPAAARAVLAGMNAHDREELYARAAEHAHHTAVPDGALASMLTGARVLGAPWAVDVLRREAARHRVAGRPGRPPACSGARCANPWPPPESAHPDRTERGRAALGARRRRPAPAPGPALARRRRCRTVLDTGRRPARGPRRRRPGTAAHRPGPRRRPGTPRRALGAAGPVLARRPQPAGDLTGPGPAPVPALAEHPDDPAEAAVAAWRQALRGRDIGRARHLARAALAPGTGTPPR